MNDDSITRLLELQHLPIGVYVIESDGRFRELNDGARRILRLSLTEPVGGRIQDYYASPEDFPALLESARAADQQQDGFKKTVVHLRVDGRDVYVEDYLKPIGMPDAGGAGLFVGCMAEITEEHESAQRSVALQQKVAELTFDIGRILHANTSTLVMVRQTLRSCATMLETALPPQKDTAAGADDTDAVATHAAALAQGVDRLLRAGDEKRRQRALPGIRWEALARHAELLRDFRSRIPVAEMRNPALRMVAADVADAAQSIPAGLLPREPVRDALGASMALQQQICLEEVAETNVAVAQMDFTLRALRDFITDEVRVHENPERLSLHDLTRDAMRQLAELAAASNVELAWRDRGDNTTLYGYQRDLVRAFANVLHNSIKYSWRRERHKTPWVAIRTGRTQGEALFEVESWGVPITEDEIAEGLIFEMGYRGQWSTDRGRLGTGIGLSDTQRVVAQHGGCATVTSRPARDTVLAETDPEYYRRPFITTVRLTLPVGG